MPSNRTPDQPSSETESATTTATAEPEVPDSSEHKQSFAERVGPRRERATAPDPFGIAGDNLAGVRLFESRQDRQMAIKFDEKPSRPVLDKLKDAGYRWNPTHRVWTHAVQQESAMSTRIEAKRLYQEVCQMIRQERGVEAEQEIPF